MSKSESLRFSLQESGPWLNIGSFIAISLILLLQLWDISLNSINWYVNYWSLKSQRSCQNYISLLTKPSLSHRIHFKSWTSRNSLSWTRSTDFSYSTWRTLALNTKDMWLSVISSCSCSCKKLFFSFTSLRSRPFDFGLMCGFENITVKSTWFHLAWSQNQVVLYTSRNTQKPVQASESFLRDLHANSQLVTEREANLTDVGGLHSLQVLQV